MKSHCTIPTLCIGKHFAVFDFDGTIFRSPAPNPNVHDKRLFRQLDQPCPHGLGWFQHLATLSPPFVPESPHPTSSWYVQEVVAAMHKRRADGDVIIVLTGRDEKFRQRVEHLASLVGVTVDIVMLKPTETYGTVKYKIEALAQLMIDGKPLSITYYEDRPQQGERLLSCMQYVTNGTPVVPHRDSWLANYEPIGRIRTVLGAKAFPFQLVMVPGPEAHLDEAVERQLVAVLAQDAERGLVSSQHEGLRSKHTR